MRKEKFTPGPWCVTNATDVFTDLGAPRADGIKAMHNDGWHIADCDVGYTLTWDGEKETLPTSEAMANARLIAAAPEMYAILSDWDEPGACGCDTAGCRDTCLPARTRAILAQARGES